MGKSVVLSAEAIGGGWTGGPVTTLGTVEHTEKDGCGSASAVLKGYSCDWMVMGAAWRTLCSSLKRQSILSVSVLETWNMKAEDDPCPRVARRLSATLFQSSSDLF